MPSHLVPPGKRQAAIRYIGGFQPSGCIVGLRLLVPGQREAFLPKGRSSVFRPDAVRQNQAFINKYARGA
jgi:hypothetical protein